MSAVLSSEPNRAFNYAILASIVLHAVLLFGFTLRERSRPAEEPAVAIVARLVEPPAAAPAPVRALPQPERATPRPRARPPAPVALPREEPAPQVESPSESASEAPPITEPAPVATSVVPAEAARVDPALTAPVAPPPRAAEALADPGSLAQYRQQLILAAPRYKRYPRVARDNNWEGTVALRITVAASGRVASLGVTRTSGYDVLDQQAQEMFRNAAAAVPVPPVLRGKEFALDVAATYHFTE
jgi:protein TonB